MNVVLKVLQDFNLLFTLDFRTNKLYCAKTTYTVRNVEKNIPSCNSFCHHCTQKQMFDPTNDYKIKQKFLKQKKNKKKIIFNFFILSNLTL